MIRYRAAGAVLAALLAASPLTACGDDNTDSASTSTSASVGAGYTITSTPWSPPPVTWSTTTTPTTTRTPARRQTTQAPTSADPIAIAKDHLAEYGVNLSTKDLISTLAASCLALQAGQSYPSLVVEMMDTQDFTAEQAGRVIGTAIAVYCPDQESKIPGR